MQNLKFKIITFRINLIWKFIFLCTDNSEWSGFKCKGTNNWILADAIGNFKV